MHDPLLTPDLIHAGVRYGRAPAPDPVTLGWLQGECATLERVLRLQYDEGKLPDTWERDIALLKPVEDTSRGLGLWSLLKHIYRVRWDSLHKAAAPGDHASEEAARALLRREPVVLQIAGHTVEVTGRSYSAMMEIAVHDLRGRELDDVIDRVAHLAARVGALLEQLRPLSAWGRRRTLQRRLAKLREAYQRLLAEREKHRMAIYAHALTPHGGPAEDIVSEAPGWWRSTGPTDDAALIAALFLAGPVRVAELPRKADDKEARDDDGFGWASLFTFFERKAGIPTGRAWDTDIGQIMASIKAGNAPYDGLEDD